MDVVDHFYTGGVNLQTKPFLKEKRLVFSLNDIHLHFFLLFLSFFPSLLRMIMLQL